MTARNFYFNGQFVKLTIAHAVGNKLLQLHIHVLLLCYDLFHGYGSDGRFVHQAVLIQLIFEL